jgi:hypothetical protein
MQGPDGDGPNVVARLPEFLNPLPNLKEPAHLLLSGGAVAGPGS